MNDHMEEKVNIESLIRKFNEGTISFEEFSLLSSYFKENEPKGELAHFFDQMWRDAGEREYAKPDISALKEIRNQIGVSRETSAKSVFILQLVKYAAVLLIGFGISSFFFNRENKVADVEATYQQIVVPYGSKSSVILPDGSTVVLNSGSKLKYLNDFGTEIRMVSLEGEGYFDVRKNARKPFVVNVSGIKVKVLGTTFNVKAYPDEKNIEASLITGAIEIYKDDSSPEKRPLVVLKPNQKAILEKESSAVVSVDTHEPGEARIFEPLRPVLKENISIKTGEETITTTAWKDNKLIFNNELFSEISRRIERWYGVKIVVVDYPELENTRLSGKFDKETVEQAIDALRYATPFRFKIEKNIITINKL